MRTTAPTADEETEAIPALVPVTPFPGTTAPPLAVVPVHTQFGGLFYLLNAWLAMGLYGDFTSPRAPNLAVSPWNLMALTGRAWFGDPFVADRIWDSLAGLADRARDDPGRDLDAGPEWLDRHLQRLTDRLRPALGMDEADGLPAFVCRYGAAIEITPSRVDVHLALSDLPLPIRIAGLDRDPGWIPAAGRAIYFLFS